MLLTWGVLNDKIRPGFFCGSFHNFSKLLRRLFLSFTTISSLVIYIFYPYSNNGMTMKPRQAEKRTELKKKAEKNVDLNRFKLNLKLLSLSSKRSSSSPLFLKYCFRGWRLLHESFTAINIRFFIHKEFELRTLKKNHLQLL